MLLTELVNSWVSCSKTAATAALANPPATESWEQLLTVLKPITTGIVSFNIFSVLQLIFAATLAVCLVALARDLLKRSPSSRLSKYLKLIESKAKLVPQTENQTQALSDLDFFKKRFLTTLMSMACARKNTAEGIKLFEALQQELSEAKNNYLNLDDPQEKRAKAA